MVVDYKNSISSVYSHSSDLIGFQIGGTFLPLDLINQLYEKANKRSMNKGECRDISHKYEYYQWNGNIEDIKKNTILEKI